MPLPPITALTPTTSPAVAAKSYPQLWTTQIAISTPSPTGDGTATVQQRNYDGTGNLDPNPANGFTINSDVWTDAGKYGMYARTMGAIVTLINLLNPVYQLRAQIAAANATLAIQQRTLAGQQVQIDAYNGQLAMWQGQPASANRTAGIATTDSNIAAITTAISITAASITTTTGQLATLAASLATAEAALA
jgi:hypothetical protein